MAFLSSGQGWPYLLVPFIPLAIVLDVVDASPSAVFFVSALGVIPTAALMGRATEELAARSGPGVGGLLNVTFGNAPELIIALFALGKGLHEVVKASIVGSIVSNVLLVLGAAMLVGGLRAPQAEGRSYREQRFTLGMAHAQAAMLILAVFALSLPLVFVLSSGGHAPGAHDVRVSFSSDAKHFSLAVAIVLIFVYVAGLVFSLRTHRELF